MGRKIPKLTSGQSQKSAVEKNTKACEDIYIKGDKVSDMKDFKDVLENHFVSKPSRDTEFASQGLCHIGEYTLITSYDPTDRSGFFKSVGNHFIGAEDWFDTTTRNSRIDIVDSEGRTKTVNLDNKSHVGGIAFHEETGKIYVSNDSKINIYDINDLAAVKDGGTLKPKDSFDFKKDSGGNAAYVQVHGDNLYAGRFSEEKNAKLIKYELDDDGNPSNPKTYKVPYAKVQGMEILEHNGKEYFIFSTSYGRGNDSQLVFAELTDEGKFETITKMTIPCMSEQISFNEDGKLGIVFESDSTYYTGSDMEIGNVLYIDANEVFREHVEDWDKTLLMDEPSLKDDIGIATI